ncbi:spermidine/putrescine ABC transporter ATP-binding protein PotA [Salidesulfovibrio brasiliensis]|uniref:spermidine/putrescine ABC transporter ATP-binding protein PotA n=1 Tax=Salidesulfovibrio brasiliensis TaxID=221711 RepID=UPI0006D19648|nr:spermidine/putrescine ABC transporter ATP-binding protein PotA [Salidesulfovibrio brasiliensis]
MTGNNPIIRLENLVKRFDGATVLDGVSLDIRDGEFLTILGPSGCGKTTILRIIAGFETPDQGRVHLDGQPLNDLPANQRRVNTVFQSYALFPHMTVRENLAFGLKMNKVSRREAERRIDDALDMVDLSHLARRYPDRLSGGQQQRVAIARAVVNNPLALLLDEPLSALDAKLRKRMQVQLKHMCRELGMTFVFVTHDQEEAFAMSDRVVVMNEGRIEQVGTPEEVYEEPVNMFVARFVGETTILDGSVVSKERETLHAMVEGKACELETARDFLPGEAIKIVLRPEDIIVEQETDSEHALWLPGTVRDTVYKGSTWDMVIALDSGKDVLVTEFFNEDDERIWHKSGDRVMVSWYKGWEVVLPDEDVTAL